MRSIWSVDNYMNVSSAVTAARPGLPIMIGGIHKQFTVGSDTYILDVPGAYPLDLEELVVDFEATSESGTTPTIDVDLQEAGDPCFEYTNINQTGGISASGTSLVVDDATNIPSAVFPILLASFTEVEDGLFKLTKYQWELSNSKSSNTLTLNTRGFYQAGQAFSDNDFVFFSNQWATMKDTAGNDIKLNDLAIDGATSSAPVKGRIALSAEGLTGLARKAFRVLVAAPSTGNVTYRVHLSGRTRGLE